MTDSAKPSVVIVGLNYAPEHTGIAPYTTSIARHLAAEGFATTAMVGYPHYPGWVVQADYRDKRDDCLDHGVRLIRLRHPVPASGAGARRILMEVVFALQVGRRLLNHEADVVVAVSPALLSVVPALLYARLRRRSVGVVVQDLYGAALAETGMGGGLLTRATAWLEEQLLRHVDGIVVIHDVFRRRLAEADVDSTCVQIIPNWSHVTMPSHMDRPAVRARLGWGDDDVIALHAGNMGVKQGLDGLVDVAKLAGRSSSRVRVVLMGDGSQRARLSEISSGIAGLSILDPLPDGEFEAALAAADVLLLHEKPGVVEMSVPSKLTSYFTAGRPVIAATHPHSGAAQLMTAAMAGDVVNAGDAASILQAIEKLAVDPDQSTAAAERARTYAEQHLTSSASLHRYAQWVSSLA